MTTQKFAPVDHTKPMELDDGTPVEFVDDRVINGRQAVRVRTYLTAIFTDGVLTAEEVINP